MNVKKDQCWMDEDKTYVVVNDVIDDGGVDVVIFGVIVQVEQREMTLRDFLSKHKRMGIN